MVREIKEWFLKAIFFYLVFATISITVSYWLGTILLNTPSIAIFSLISSFFIFKKFDKTFSIKLPSEVPIAAILALVLVAYPVLIVHPFYLTGNDVLHTTTLRTLKINNKIPETYAPFADISFNYTCGFHLFAKLFADVLALIPDYLVLWALGLTFVFLQPILIYLLVLELFQSKKAALYSAILLIGTKDIYQNMFFGMFPREAAACFFFATAFLILKRSKLVYLFLPTIAMLHSGFFILATIFFALMAFIKRKTYMVKYAPAILLASPAFYQSYLVIFLGYATLQSTSVLASFNLFSRLISIMLWIGWVPFVILAIGFLHRILKKSFDINSLLGIIILLIGLALYFAMLLKNVPANNVPIWLCSFGAVIFGSLWLSSLRLPAKVAKLLPFFILMLCITSFFASSYLQSRVAITMHREASFAFKFRKLDPELKTVAFLMKSGKGIAKIAELSNKIPYNALQGFFLPIPKIFVEESDYYSKLLEQKGGSEVSGVLLNLDKGYLELVERDFIVNKIIEGKCTQCISDLNVEYVVIDSAFAGFDLNAKPLLDTNGIKLYRIR